MPNEAITVKTVKINEYLHHIDLMAYGTSRRLSVYLAEFNNATTLFDCGSSLDAKRVIRYCKKNEISLSSFKYLIPSHHHFDHAGGFWKLYNEIKKHNPNVKILTNQQTMALLNNFEDHLARAKRTYGNLIGTMEKIEESAFQIIEPSTQFNATIPPIAEFEVNTSKVQLVIYKTPGHTPDHVCPAFIRDGEIEFIFWGEAAGTIYHASKLITMPTSMPVYYNHYDYMNSLRSLKKLTVQKAGFGHFGVINGYDNVKLILDEHETFLEEFRQKIIDFYAEKPQTKYVFEKILPFLTPRTDLPIDSNPIFKNIALGIVYGMMMDLGYRKD
ncbi:MAG: MBL fold metallo-hydrolase [Promethearchaeota archaeon]|nr:MAG: MBL fold metallo-hydrolase [Candidatus Lokiarchaeota archaeon]